MAKDYPEHFRAGLKPHSPKEMYYFSRGPNLNHYNFTQFNRVVDISSVIEKKINADIANRHWGLGRSRDPEEIRKRYMSGGRRRAVAERLSGQVDQTTGERLADTALPKPTVQAILDRAMKRILRGGGITWELALISDRPPMRERHANAALVARLNGIPAPKKKRGR